VDVLYFLIPVSLVLAGGGLLACVWAIKSGQYDDVESPAQKLVFEDKEGNH
jgi:cbb3-type cytochrome oxidase maturation protein